MNEYWPVIIVGAVVAGSYARRRLLRAAQPLRLELAEKGEELLANPKLPKKLHVFIDAILNSAFNNRFFLFIAIFAIPVVAVFIVIHPKRIIASMKELSAKDAEVESRISEINKLHNRIMFYNHPILLLFVEFEILIVIPIAILLSGLIHGSAPRRANSDEVLSFIEAKEGEKFAFVRRVHASTNIR